MINNNYKGIMLYAPYNDANYPRVKKLNGTIAQPSSSVSNLKTFLTLKYSDFLSSSNGGCTFALGTSDTPATANDIVFATDPTQPVSESNVSTLIDYTNVSITSAQITRNTSVYDGNLVYIQTYSYNGGSPLTIREVGLIMHGSYDVGGEFFIAREVLDSPITVNNGDTFTVSMVIG